MTPAAAEPEFSLVDAGATPTPAGDDGEDRRDDQPGDFVAGVASIDGGHPESAWFVKASSSFGVGRPSTGEDPIFIPFDAIDAVDELGEPGSDGPTVEISTSSGLVIVATFPQRFCDSLVASLVESSATESSPVRAAPSVSSVELDGPVDEVVRPSPTPAANPFAPAMPEQARSGQVGVPGAGVSGTDLPSATPGNSVDAASIPEPWSPPVATSEQSAAFRWGEPPAVSADHLIGEPALAPTPPQAESGDEEHRSGGTGALPPDVVLPEWLEAPEERAARLDRPIDADSALVIEEVTYLGGHPDIKRKRKKCIGTVTCDAIEVSGRGVAISIPWDQVVSIEAQNPDEARFRISTRIHSESTALVVQLRDGSTVLLEAHSCPKVPLQGAISQLVSGVGVVVV